MIVAAVVHSGSALADPPDLDSTTLDQNAVVATAPGVPDRSIYAGFENNENVSLYSGNLLITHASGPSYPLDGGGSFGLVRSYNSLRVRRDRVRYKNEDNSHVFHVLLNGRSWVGFGWTMHLGRMFQRAKHNSFGPEDFNNEGRDLFFVDSLGTEHDMLHQKEAHPLLNYSLVPAQGTEPAHYDVITEDGTKYRLEQIVMDDIPADGKGWIRNHDRNGWYATRIEDVHGNGVEIQYARSGPYPETISRIRSINDAAMEITTQLWTAGDSNDDDLLLDGSGNKTWSPTFVGMLKEIHATGFKGTRDAPQDVVYKFVYGIQSETDDGQLVDVPVLARVILPQMSGSTSGAIDYGYRRGALGRGVDPVFPSQKSLRGIELK
jgi:hypothetical protein